MEAHGNYKPGYDSEYDTAKNETTSDDHHHGSGSVEKEGKNDDYKISSYTKMNCPPSKQMRQPLSSSSSQRSTRRLPSYNNKIVQESANNCINSRFDHDTFSTAKSMALKFANPCGLDMNQYNNNYCPPPRTPSTVGSSFSDDESVETSSSLAQHSSHPKRNNLKSRCSDDNRSGHPFLRRTVIQRRSSRSSEAYSQFSTEKDEGGYPPLTRGIAPNFDKNDGEDVVIVVGDQEYPLPRTNEKFVVKYLLSRQERVDDHFSYVDLSTHSPNEFEEVMEFFENNRNTETWDEIHWKNIHIILPWFVEFQSLPLMTAVDSFLCHNGLGSGGQGFGCNDNGNTKRNKHISLSNLLILTQIAFRCGLESTKSHARRLLKQCLLEPRKEYGGSDVLDDSNHTNRPPMEAATEDIELEWTLHDLQILAQTLQAYSDLREYLWDTSVIVYLPHDLDISNSTELVSNALFPYLLREGMMQMMIVEGIRIDSSADLSYSQANESSFNSSVSIGFSYSESTSCSDTTIPTNPAAQRKNLTQEEMRVHLNEIVMYLDKFRAEKVARIEMHKEQLENSLLANESSFDDIGELSVDGVTNSRSSQDYGSRSDKYDSHQVERRSSTSSRGRVRGVSTFAC
ncbi:unnamed protein product [Pseudo-nitzschia multistriata]|uniref:Uncharacterized protein n=1 Tax=Pseudo-nitzschia multistriata TaxID=183589 RepID=A0A448Z8X7_9STRA|nr:unnamed protein product [Pseudo-nitzschia multistriata]